MKTLIVSICITYCAVTARGQGFGYIETDRIALNVPIEQTTTTHDIAQYIKRHFDSDSKRIRAIYTWVSNNIKYDRNSVHLVILEEDREERVTYALRRKKGVCENFAAIFNDLCIKAGIPSFIIQGYTRQSGGIDRTPHVWCTAFTDGQWFMYDPTWDAGFISNNHFISKVQTNYFKIKPPVFIQTHLPFDPLFQLMDYPVNYKEFKTGTTRSANQKDHFSYRDSIRKYADSDSLNRYFSAFQRISNYGWPASLIDTRLKQLKLEIELIYQDRDMALYNSVVDTYNRALGILNKFITYRNNQFVSLKDNSEIDSMFDLITQKMALAQQRLLELNQSTATLALDTGDIAKKLSDLAYKAKEQREFFEEHLKSSKQ